MSAETDAAYERVLYHLRNHPQSVGMALACIRQDETCRVLGSAMPDDTLTLAEMMQTPRFRAWFQAYQVIAGHVATVAAFRRMDQELARQVAGGAKRDLEARASLDEEQIVRHTGENLFDEDGDT